MSNNHKPESAMSVTELRALVEKRRRELDEIIDSHLMGIGSQDELHVARQQLEAAQDALDEALNTPRDLRRTDVIYA
jgi:hypothetical protein